jgi:hypothetical protein
MALELYETGGADAQLKKKIDVFRGFPSTHI